MARQKKIKPEEPVEVLLTPQERELILEHTFAGGDLTKGLRLAQTKGRKVVAKYTLEDLDELLGHIAAEANHSTDKKLQKQLYALFNRLQEEMQSYDDGQWPHAL